MKYMGAKSRIAKQIVPIIQSYINKYHTHYLECFGGGMNVIDKIEADIKVGSDVNKYLIALHKHVQANLPLYDSVPKDLYDRAKAAWYKNDISEFEEWQLGCIGFLASFNGKGFQGGICKTRIRENKERSKI